MLEAFNAEGQDFTPKIPHLSSSEFALGKRQSERESVFPIRKDRE